MENKNQKIEKVAFGGGCFWCTEAVFLILKGVRAVTPGYAGGNTENPTYEQVSSGTTGHAEVILVEYDAKVISFENLVGIFFDSHDPTEINRQGNGVGTQYRSVLFYTTEEQKAATETRIEELNNSGKHKKPIVTEITPLKKFYPAEEYHKDYYAKHLNEGYPVAIIKPKVEKIKDKYRDFLR
jgi:peptide-methionine (S)-S-oxide reductase